MFWKHKNYFLFRESETSSNTLNQCSSYFSFTYSKTLWRRNLWWLTDKLICSNTISEGQNLCHGSEDNIHRTFERSVVKSYITWTNTMRSYKNNWKVYNNERHVQTETRTWSACVEFFFSILSCKKRIKYSNTTVTK